MKLGRWIPVLLGAVLAVAGTTSHALVIGFSPSAQTKALGETADVNVLLSGLTAANQVVSGFSINVNYSGGPTVEFLGGEYGTLLGDPNDFLQTIVFAPSAAGGVIELFETSFLTDIDLANLQGDSVVLATLHFRSPSAITSALSITYTPNDITGFEEPGGGPDPVATVMNPDPAGGTIVWGDGGPTGVPIPATPLLLGGGLLALLGLRRFQR